MIYLYAYLAICCICYYQIYNIILFRYGSVDCVIQLLRDSLKHEYGTDFTDKYTDLQLKRVFYVVVFLTSPFLLITGVFR